MKYLLILSILIYSYGCKDAYPKEIVVIEIGGKGEVDSITFINDTVRIYKSHFIKNDTVMDNSNIKIINHKGDVLTGKSVKNVYNK